MPTLPTRPLNRHHWVCCFIVVLASTAPPLAGAEKPYAIFLMKVDGSQARKLAQVEGYADHECPCWSKDGKRVAFHAMDAATRQVDLFIVNADGTGLKTIGRGGNPDWSGDDKQIAFDAEGEILVQNIDGQGRDRVTTGQCPRWSPDGSQMAVVESRMLHVVDLVSGERRALFDQPFAMMYPETCWSPDGRHIALVAQPLQGPRRQLLIVSSEGVEHGVKARLQTKGGMSGFPSFSPDGKRLAYSAAYLILTLDVEGDAKPRLLPDQKGKNFEPDWSPDGEWLVFKSNRD